MTGRVRPPATEEDSQRKKSREYGWPGKISDFIGGLSPGIKASDISYEKLHSSEYHFSIKEKKDTSFRVLKIKVTRSTDNQNGTASGKVTYEAEESPIENCQIRKSF